MALKIGLATYVSGGFTNPVIWRLYEAGTGVLVDTHQELGPHGQVYNFDFVDNIRDIVYTIKFYDQPGGTGTGNLIKSHDVTVSTSTVTDGEVIEIIVDGGDPGDPDDQDTSVVIDDLHDKDFYLVQRGIGPLHYERNPEFTWNNTTNTLTLLNGNVFNASDSFFAVVKAKYVINPPGTVPSAGMFKDVVLLTADETLVSTDFGKKYLVMGAAAVVIIDLPAKADIIEKVPLHIESLGEIGGNHNNVVMRAASGETITSIFGVSNTFILGQGESAQIIKLGSTLYGFNPSADRKRVGQLEWGYSADLPNRLWADGSEYALADYPDLAKAIGDGRCGTVVDYATWALTASLDGETVFKNKGFFATDGTNFKVPDLRNRSIRALRYADGTTDTERTTQGAGGYQHHANKAHYHILPIWADNPSLAYGVETVSARDVEDFTSSGAGKTALHRTATTTETESRPKNIGLIPLIIF